MTALAQNQSNDPISGSNPGDPSAPVEVLGRILTAPGEEFEQSPTMRQIVLLTDAGQMFFSSSFETDNRLYSFKARAAQRGYAINHEISVSMEELQRAYMQYASGDGSPGIEPDLAQATDTANQRELLALVQQAALEKATDLRIVVQPRRAVVRIKVDGLYRNLKEMMPDKARELCGAAFAMADVSDASYTPGDFQDARISDQGRRLPHGVQAIRVQWNPTVFGGRAMIMRLLYAESGSGAQTRDRSMSGDLRNLGYHSRHIDDIQRMRSQPLGIVIVAGPTNSGKSTTAKYMLERIVQERRGEWAGLSVEDPPEYVIEGVEQMPVVGAATAEERDEAFRKAITAALRSDPNALLIGEVRDTASAKLAFQGALTGIWVMTSLHASSALAVIDRLRDMGVEDYKLADHTVVTGLIGQRLVRLLCPSCRVDFSEAVARGEIADPGLPSRMNALMSRLGQNRPLYARNPHGCADCKGSGYRGRSVVAETIVPDENFMRLVAARDKIGARRYWLDEQNGFTMTEHAVLKMLQGDIGPVEIEQTVGVVELDQHGVATVNSLLEAEDQ